jgi:hypothetical protein
MLERRIAGTRITPMKRQRKPLVYKIEIEDTGDAWID